MRSAGKDYLISLQYTSLLDLCWLDLSAASILRDSNGDPVLSTLLRTVC